MMKFFGGLPFALFLIAASACYAITGTVLESLTGSHLYAASFTYNHVIFQILLGLFFLNILLSTLRRWPFKKKHIPFLMTHLGLLLLLSGAMVKNIWGVQGVLRVKEGSSTDRLFLQHTKALYLESPLWEKPVVLPLHALGNTSSPKFSVANYYPHAEPFYETWVKKEELSIRGLKPFRLADQLPNAPQAFVKVFEEESSPYEVYGLKEVDVQETIKALYLRGLDVVVGDRTTRRVLYAGALSAILDGLADVQGYLHLDYDEEKGFATPFFLLHHKGEELGMALDGPKALLNVPLTAQSTLSVDFVRSPLLAFIEDKNHAVHCVAFDAHGRVFAKCFLPDQLSTLAVYDKGYGGYASILEVPFGPSLQGRSQLEALSALGSSPLNSSFSIETPVHLKPVSSEMPGKWEDSRPSTLIRIQSEGRSQYVPLIFDPSGFGLKWPAMGGELLMRFQPEEITLPYSIRPRQARTITYSNSSQPYSYECDIELTDQRTKEVTYASLSMNRVLETADGYRFYLSHIGSSNPGSIKEVQITVNKDPVKYLLTYPGAAFLSLGIISLFLKRRTL